MFIDLDDHVHTAADRGWGIDERDRVPEPADRSGTRTAVRTALATLICTLIDWTEREDGGNYLLKPGECGDCDRHPIAVSDTAFHHSWAVDVDFTMGNCHGLPTHVGRIWNQYGFAWGGDYHGPNRDWLHFEFIGTPTDAIQLSKAALRDLAPGA
jgi:hypothetical protein